MSHSGSMGSNLPLLFLAFVIALMIKLAVQEDEQISERVVEAQVTYNHPAGSNVVSYEKVETVKVNIRGKASEIIQLSTFTVEVVASLPLGMFGAVDITLDPTSVRFRALGDFEVTSIEPNHFTVQVEPRRTATVPVRAELVGEPAAGAQASEPTVRPAWVEISGPESKVAKVSQLYAEVSLDGHARSFEESVAVVAPEPLIRVQPGRVLVNVPMQEPELSIDLQDETATNGP